MWYCYVYESYPVCERVYRSLDVMCRQRGVDRTGVAQFWVFELRVKSKEDNTHTRDRARRSPTRTQENSTILGV